MKKAFFAWTVGCLLLVAGMALAQEPAPVAPAAEPAPVAQPAPAPAPAPVAEPAPAPEPAPMVEPEPLPPAADEMTEPPPEEDGGIPGWFRVDVDRLATQFWFGATHDLGGVAIASDVYLTGSFAELDLGLAFSLGPVALTPMVGVGFDFTDQQMTALIAPQLFTIVDTDSVYFESWIQLFLYDMFVDPPLTDLLHTRNFLLFKVSDVVGLGPHIEADIAVKNKPVNKDGDEAALAELIVGGALNLGYGENNSLLLMLGYDVAADDFDRNALAGRFTFVRTW